MTAAARGLVLVVEDEPDLLELLQLLLESAGYRVRVARTGVEGLAALRRERPDVVLLDLMMPVMDGWQLREAQLRDPGLAQVPVVVMTGAGAAAEARAATTCGDVVLRKPFSFDRLLEAVARHCPDPGAERPPR